MADTTTTRFITEEAGQELVRKAFTKMRIIALETHYDCKADDYWGNGVAMARLKERDEESWEILDYLYDLAGSSGKNGAYRFVGSSVEMTMTVDGEEVTVAEGETVEGACDTLEIPSPGIRTFAEANLAGSCWTENKFNADAGRCTAMRLLLPPTLSMNLSDLAYFCKNLVTVAVMPGRPTYLSSALRSYSSSVTSLDLRGWDTSECIATDYMFADNSALQELRLGSFSFKSVVSTRQSYMFNSCTALTTVTGEVEDLGVSLDLSPCPLTRRSALVFIDGLVETEEDRTLSLSDTTKALLSDDDIALATDKGWTVA